MLQGSEESVSRWSSAPERLPDGRLVVDPNAMSALVDWALAQDFPPDAAEEIRDASWR